MDSGNGQSYACLTFQIVANLAYRVGAPDYNTPCSALLLQRFFHPDASGLPEVAGSPAADSREPLRHGQWPVKHGQADDFRLRVVRTVFHAFWREENRAGRIH